MPAGMGPGSKQTTEKAKDFKGTIFGLLRYMRGHSIAIAFALICAIASTAFNVIGPDILGKITTKIFEGLMGRVQGGAGIDFEGIGKIMAILICLYLASCLFSFIQGLLMTSVTQKICFKLRAQIVNKIAHVPMEYFEDHSKGDVLSRITNDVDTLGASLNQTISQVITSVTQMIGVTIMMFVISPILAGLTLLVIPVSLVLVGIVVHFSQKYFVAQQTKLGDVNGVVEEDIGGHTIIQLFNREKKSESAFNLINNDLYNSAWKSQFLSGLLQPVMMFVSNMAYVMVVVVGAMLAIAQMITVGDIQAFMQYARNFTTPITQLANVSNMLQSMAASAERVFEFLAAPDESEPEVPEKPKLVDGAVSFSNVEFGYVPDQTVITDFTSAAKPGQTVAIVGPTGAGKSTLMKLMLRFYDVRKGSVSVDNLDVKKWERATLRKNFGMVLQDSWLFEGTIRENVRYGRLDATDEEVEEACRIASCDHFIRTLSGGYDFRINEAATNISQGQRQLITIARAVLADRPILVLDEATSNVDTRTEILIQRAMDKLMEGRTSFVVAHRLSTIKNADIILVMRDGDVVETGTHKDLLAANGFYANLYNSQFTDCD